MYDGILSLVAAPGSEPVSLDEIKAHLNEIGTGKDGEIIGMMLAAARQAEAYTNRALLTQTWDLWLPRFCYGRQIPLPKPPLQQVTSIKYIDTAGVEQTYASTNYVVGAPAGPFARKGWVERFDWAIWPDHYDRLDAVRIRFVAGWTGPEQVPDGIRSAIKVIVTHLNEHRGDRQEAGIANAEPRALPPTAEALLDPYRAF